MMAKKLLTFFLVCSLLTQLLVMIPGTALASSTEPELENVTLGFTGGTLGLMPTGWTGTNFAYGNSAGGYYGQASNYKVGQGYGADGYMIYNNLNFTGDLSYKVTLEGYDANAGNPTSDTVHRAHIIFNYQDVENYYYVDFGANPTSGTVHLYKKVGGVVQPAIASYTAGGVGLKPGITATITYNATAKTISVSARKSDQTTVNIFTDVVDSTFVGGKIGVGAKSSSFMNFSSIVLSGMAFDTTPVPTAPPSFTLSPDAEQTTFNAVIPTSGSIPAWWEGNLSGYKLLNWGGFESTSWGSNHYMAYGKYVWQDNFTYQLRMCSYAASMNSVAVFLYQNASNFYAVKVNSFLDGSTIKVKGVKLVKVVGGTETILAEDANWTGTDGNATVNITYNAGSMTVKVNSTTVLSDIVDPSPSFTSGLVGFGHQGAGHFATGITCTGKAREWKESGTISFPARPKTMRKLPTITSAVEVPVPSGLPVVKTYPNGLFKAFVIDFDDGTQPWCEGFDMKAIEVLNKYNARGTFNLSADWGGTAHQYTAAEITKFGGMYKNHEIATHQMLHQNPGDIDAATLGASLQTSLGYLKQMTAAWGYPAPTTETPGLALAQVGGWAYPGGNKDIDAEKQAVVESLGIKYGRRSVVRSANAGDYNVTIPTSFFNWVATCSLSTASGTQAALTHQNTYLASDLKKMTAFYCWNHAWDIWPSAANTIDKSIEFETLIKKFAQNSDTIWNPGVLELVDYVNASRQLTVSKNANDNIVLYNPSNAIDVWAKVSNVDVMIPAGQTIVMNEVAIGQGTTTYVNSGSNDIHFSANVFNGTTSDATVAIIAALYDNAAIPTLVDLAVLDTTITKNTGAVHSGTFTVANPQNYKVKYFVWNATDGLKPLGDSVTQAVTVKN